MTILERLLRHDAWTTRALLVLASGLGDAELDLEFDVGHRTLRRTFVHIVANMECWCDLMTARPQRWAGRETRLAESVAGLIERLDRIADELLALGGRVTDEGREDDEFVDYLDDPPARKPLGAGLVHVATHGMHHRAQCLNMLRHLGVSPLPPSSVVEWMIENGAV